MTLLKPLQVNGLTSVAHGPDEPTNPQHETPAGVSPVRSFAGHSAIAVEDIDRSIAFYAALGFEALWRDPDWAFLRSPGAGAWPCWAPVTGGQVPTWVFTWKRGRRSRAGTSAAKPPEPGAWARSTAIAMAAARSM